MAPISGGCLAWKNRGPRVLQSRIDRFGGSALVSMGEICLQVLCGLNLWEVANPGRPRVKAWLSQQGFLQRHFWKNLVTLWGCQRLCKWCSWPRVEIRSPLGEQWGKSRIHCWGPGEGLPSLRRNHLPHAWCPLQDRSSSHRTGLGGGS